MEDLNLIRNAAIAAKKISESIKKYVEREK